VTGPAVEPRPGAFGKLPLAADFVAINAGGPGVRGFTEWLQEGVGLGHARLGSSWDTVFPRMPAWRFLLTMGPGGIALAGAIVAGRDRSGRRFPFTLFAGMPVFDSASTGPRLTRLLPFLEHAEAQARRLVDLGETSGPSPMRPVAETVEGLSATLSELDVEAPAAPETSPPISILSALDPAGAGHLLARVGANLLEVAARSNADGGRPPAYGLRAPVPAGDSGAMTVVRFWVDLVHHALGKEGAPRAIFWSSVDPADRGCVDLYFRPPGTMAFLHLVDPAFESDALYPLNEADPAHPGSAARAWIDAVNDLAARDATLEDVLALVGPRP
jgi:type VI secretion system protein ImpM